MTSLRLAPVVLALTWLLVACAGASGAPDSVGAAGGLEVTGTNALSFEPDTLTTATGTITVELTAESAVPHTLVVEDADGDRLVVEAEAGKTATGAINLPPGDYVFYCSVPGHREAGMEGTLAVTQ